MKITRLLVAAGAAAVALSLAGCWGGDGADTPTPAVTEVPDSAGVSAAAFVSYILLLNASDESTEPLTIKDSFAVPPEDNAEPTPLV